MSREDNLTAEARSDNTRETDGARWCGKHRYPTKKDALTAINARTTGRQQYRHNRPEALRAYPCSRCKGWHLTHTAAP